MTASKIDLTAISLLTGAELKGIISPKGKNKKIIVKGTRFNLSGNYLKIAVPAQYKLCQVFRRGENNRLLAGSGMMLRYEIVFNFL